MIIRPATPGFIVTLVATILLAIVSFSVPWFKSVYFLKALVDFNGQNASATFGVLGYCLDTGGTVNCTTPRLGYEFDPNALLGNKTPIKIPEVLVKWLTYALILHIIALVAAAGSAVFGLLAHVREMSMACCSTCMSGLGAVVALLAFVFDLAFFFLAKARINKVPGGSAQMGNAIWLTLAAWVLLFFAGCFYSFGRCCIANRPRGPRDSKLDPPYTGSGHEPHSSEAMRLDAVKAEAERKARQKQGEVGLPPFQEYDPRKPLTSIAYEDDDEVYLEPPRRQASAYSNNQGAYTPQTHPGYAPATPGTSAMDAYYNRPTPSTSPQPSTYPPQQSQTQYPSAQNDAYGNAAPTHGQYLGVGAYSHQQYPSNVTNQSAYGHHPQDTSYYSAVGSHYQQPSHNPEQSYNATSYANPVPYPSPGTLPPLPPSTHASSGSPASYYPPQNQFATGGVSSGIGHDNYTFSNTPSPVQPVGVAADTSYLAFANPSTSYAPQVSHDAVAPKSRRQSIPQGPRSPSSPNPTSYSQQSHRDSPPGYSGESTAWPNEKR